MAVLVLLLFLLSSIGGSDAVWCVCRSDQGTAALQKAIDYACGAGADCTPIKENGNCYNPNTPVAHCSYAANSYFQKMGQAQTACNFSGAATATTTDPSYSGCSFPATATAAGTSTTPTSTTPTTGMPTTSTPTSFTPGTGTTGTTTGGTTTGGVLGGLGPTGTTTIDGTGTDAGHLPKAPLFLILFSTLFSLALCVV